MEKRAINNFNSALEMLEKVDKGPIVLYGGGAEFLVGPLSLITFNKPSNE